MLVTIEPVQTAYRLIVERVTDNGSASYFSVVSDMNGTPAQAYDKDGKPEMAAIDKDGNPMPKKCRITSDGPNAFNLEWIGPLGFTLRYEVSADGKTLTIQDLPGKSAIVGGRIDSKGVTIPRHVRVLNKVSPAPST